MILSAISGGITGIIGSSLATYNNIRLKKLDIKEQRLKNALELTKLKKLTTNTNNLQNATILQDDIDKTKNKKDLLDNLNKLSNKNELSMRLINILLNIEGPLKYISCFIGIILITAIVIIEIFCKSIRPSITIFYSMIMFYIIYKCYIFLDNSSLQNVITSKSLVIIIDTITYICTSISLYWFGDRTSSKFINNLYNKNN